MYASRRQRADIGVCRKKDGDPNKKKGAALHRSSFFFGSSSRLPFSTLHLPRAPARCLPAIQRASTSTPVAITDADSDAGPVLPADSNAALQASISDFLPPYTAHQFIYDCDQELEKAGIIQDSFVLCRIFRKSGSGPKNGEQYGALFVDEDELVMVPKQELICG
ncbi:hypothetical protein LXL04_030435 [Taraxacum kok-saghyz]